MILLFPFLVQFLVKTAISVRFWFDITENMSISQYRHTLQNCLSYTMVPEPPPAAVQ